MIDLFHQQRSNGHRSEYTQMRVMPLAAIWLSKPIIISTGARAVRIVPCTQLSIRDDGQLIDTFDQPTHEVTECIGVIGDNFLQFKLRSLRSGEVSFLTIKQFSEPVNIHFALADAYDCSFCRGWFSLIQNKPFEKNGSVYCCEECYKAERREEKGVEDLEMERQGGGIN